MPTRRAAKTERIERLSDCCRPQPGKFVEHGFDAARVSAIARRAGLTSGAVYARWPTKSDVMAAALDYVFHKILPASRVKGVGRRGEGVAGRDRDAGSEPPGG